MVLIIFAALFITVFFSIRPFKFHRFNLDMASVSILSVVFLYFFKIIDFDTVRNGIMGYSDFRPYEIIIIFFTTAYASVSTDITGFFDYIAYHIVRLAKGNGNRLFLYFYVFSIILTVFTSNDIVILTLTPIIFYVGKHAHINVLPLLFAEFFGANTSSMLLYIGNPTNIIVGNTLRITFLDYFLNMWKPALVATLLNYILLRFFFRKEITREFSVIEHSEYLIRNRYDACISFILMAGMLISLIFSEYAGVKIYVVTTFFALLFLIEDFIFTIYYHFAHISHKKYGSVTKRFFRITIPEEKNDVFIITGRIPWKILPFVFSIFIFVSALNSYGFISLMAEIFTKLSINSFWAVSVMGFAALIISNILNNQPMTILLSNLLINPLYVVEEETFIKSAYSLIAASNLGANLTLIGALAGVMWAGILKEKGLNIDYWSFFKTGIKITPIVFFAVLLTILFQ